MWKQPLYLVPLYDEVCTIIQLHTRIHLSVTHVSLLYTYRLSPDLQQQHCSMHMMAIGNGMVTTFDNKKCFSAQTAT